MVSPSDRNYAAPQMPPSQEAPSPLFLQILSEVNEKIKIMETQAKAGAERVAAQSAEIESVRKQMQSMEVQLVLTAQQKEENQRQVEDLAARVARVGKENQQLRGQVDQSTKEMQKLMHQNLEEKNRTLAAQQRAQLQAHLIQLEKELSEMEKEESINPMGAGAGMLSGALWGGLFGGPWGAVAGSLLGGGAGGYAPALDAAREHKERKERLLQDLEETRSKLA